MKFGCTNGISHAIHRHSGVSIDFKAVYIPPRGPQSGIRSLPVGRFKKGYASGVLVTRKRDWVT
jgi:hypothetical protein